MDQQSCLAFSRPPLLLHQLGEEAAVVDASGVLLPEKAVLVLADAVQDLPLRRRTSPAFFSISCINKS